LSSIIGDESSTLENVRIIRVEQEAGVNLVFAFVQTIHFQTGFRFDVRLPPSFIPHALVVYSDAVFGEDVQRMLIPIGVSGYKSRDPSRFSLHRAPSLERAKRPERASTPARGAKLALSQLVRFAW
jgi:hypothetical protein